MLNKETRRSQQYLNTNSMKTSEIPQENGVFNETGSRINSHRSDNAPELCKGVLQEFYKNKGIEHQKSCSYTPQQNGVVERKHRHLLEVSRALFFQSKVPIDFWGECVLCATHIINRMPSQILQNISPYEKFFQEAPDLSYMKTFGCLCFVATNSSHRSKFDSRAESHVFCWISCRCERLQSVKHQHHADSGNKKCYIP